MTRSVIARSGATKQSGRKDCFATLATTDNVLFLKEIESQLRSAGVVSARAEAETLVTHFARMSRLDLFTGDKKIGPSARRAVEKALLGRKKGQPLSHLTREAPFYGYSFRVTRDTLIPRPETERLVEEVLALLDAHYKGKNPRILDVGTGSGCIAVSLTLQSPACRMTALDSSRKALEVARKNAALFGLSGKIQLVQSRLFGSFGRDKKAFWDIVVSNPPYIPAGDLRKLPREVRSEPRLALDGGARGLDTIEALLDEAPFYLKKDGWLCVEIGRGQAAALTKRLRKSAFKNFRFAKDLNGIDRVLIAQHG